MQSNIQIMQKSLVDEIKNWIALDTEPDVLKKFRLAVKDILQLNTYTFTSETTIDALVKIITKDETIQDMLLTFITNVKYDFICNNGDWAALAIDVKNLTQSLKKDPTLSKELQDLTSTDEVTIDDTILIVLYNLCKSVYLVKDLIATGDKDEK